MFRFNLLHPCQIMGRLIAFREHRGNGVFVPMQITVKSLTYFEQLGTQYVTINKGEILNSTVPAATAVEVVKL